MFYIEGLLWGNEVISCPSRAVVFNPTPGNPPLCILHRSTFSMSPLFNTPDSDNQLIRREIHELHCVCQIRETHKMCRAVGPQDQDWKPLLLSVCSRTKCFSGQGWHFKVFFFSVENTVFQETTGLQHRTYFKCTYKVCFDMSKNHGCIGIC